MNFTTHNELILDLFKDIIYLYYESIFTVFWC